MSFSPKLVGWSLSILLTACGSLQAREKSPQELQKSCRNFVQGFYDWYFHKQASWDQALKHYAFSRELRRRLHDEERQLDFDPFIAGQDFSPKGYAAGKVRSKSDRYRVDVYCLDCDGKSKELIVIPELLYKDGCWLFVNFHYKKDPKYPMNDNLLNILKWYQKERRKSSG